MATELQQQSKRELLESLLEGGMVMIHLDARADGVQVPAQVRDNPLLGLNLSYRFQGPIEVGEDQINATLSFSGEPFACALPFGAVYAMISHRTGEGFFFPGDAPSTALAELADFASPEALEALAELLATENHSSHPKRPLHGLESSSPDSVSEAGQRLGAAREALQGLQSVIRISPHSAAPAGPPKPSSPFRVIDGRIDKGGKNKTERPRVSEDPSPKTLVVSVPDAEESLSSNTPEPSPSIDSKTPSRGHLRLVK